MIFRATFVGRTLHAIGIFYPITTYCYGDNEEAARLDLYERYEHIQRLNLELAPVLAVKDAKPGDRIYLIGENGRIIENAAYTIEPHELVEPVAAMKHATGVTESINPDHPCIVWTN